MIHIDEILPMSVHDLQTALAGVWGVDESAETFTELALGSLNVRLYQGSKTVSPQEYSRGAGTDYITTLAILSFTDGTSVTETLVGPKTYTKTIKMGVLIARQA